MLRFLRYLRPEFSSKALDSGPTTMATAISGSWDSCHSPSRDCTPRAADCASR